MEKQQSCGNGDGDGNGNGKGSSNNYNYNNNLSDRFEVENVDLKLVGSPATVNSVVDDDVAVTDVPASVADGVETLMMMKNSENFINTSITYNLNQPSAVEAVEASTVKRKRGRPPRNQAAAAAAAGGTAASVVVQSASSKIKEDEDVCFICFDGGSLVLCDHRGCPKAYHPACIKRDEAFFQGAAKWNCGWHLCNSCQKAAYYMCYTCTFSLCKRCTSSADFSTVRGTKGFCGTCMKTIMLIENGAQANGELVKVDFDDKSSWEYLFKVYWVCLKEELSLTLDELTRAKNPWKEAGVVAARIKSGVELRSDISRANMETDLSISKANDQAKDLNAAYCPDISCAMETDLSKSKVKEHTKDLNTAYCQDISCTNMETGISKSQTNYQRNDLNTAYRQDISCTNMEIDLSKSKANDEAKDLQSSHMQKSGSDRNDTKWATKELLEFVAHMKNGDTSMISSFGLQALLLEYVKRNNLRDPLQETQIICDSRLMSLFGKARIGHIEMLRQLEYHLFTTLTSQVGIHGANTQNQLMKGNDRKRKTYRKSNEKAPGPNSAEYAAINLHNINLMYLRRDLMENLIDDINKFQEKAIGSVVRIKISAGDHKHEAYRLVQVTGTNKASEPYKLGSGTTDVVLEILNLDKKELIRIDELSNQEFSEDECTHFRQSVKCGLNKCFKVAEIKEKAMVLKAVKVNDLFFDNVATHRECVEKLQLLNSPEERQRMLQDVPEVHADPKMDPLAYDCDNDAGISYDKGKDDKKRRRASGAGRKKKVQVLSQSGGDALNEGSNYADRNGTIHTRKTESSLTEAVGTSNGRTSTGSAEQSISNINTDIIWLYRDPMGKVQGPFPLVQLYRWRDHFPPGLKIWKVHDNLDHSILLTDALQGKFSKDPPPVHIQAQEMTAGADERADVEHEQVGDKISTKSNDFAKTEGLISHSSGKTTTITSTRDNDKTEVVRNSELGRRSSGNVTTLPLNDFAKSEGLITHSSGMTTTITSTRGNAKTEVVRNTALGSRSSGNVPTLPLNDFANSEGLITHSSGTTTTITSTRDNDKTEVVRNSESGHRSSGNGTTLPLNGFIKSDGLITHSSGKTTTITSTRGNDKTEVVRNTELGSRSSGNVPTLPLNDYAKSEGLIIHSSGKTTTVTSTRGNGETEVVRNTKLGSHSSGKVTPFSLNDASRHGIIGNDVLGKSDVLSSHSSGMVAPAHVADSKEQTQNVSSADTPKFQVVKSQRKGKKRSGQSETVRKSKNIIDNGGHNQTRLDCNIPAKGGEFSSHSSHMGAPADTANSKGKTQNVAVCLDSAPAQPQLSGSLHLPTFPAKSSDTPKVQVGDSHRDEKWSSGQSEIIPKSTKITDSRDTSRTRPDCNLPAIQSPGQNEKCQVSQSLETVQNIGIIDLNLGGPTQNPSNEELRVQPADMNLFMSLNVPAKDSVSNSSLLASNTQFREAWDLNISHQAAGGMVDNAISPTSGIDPIPDAPTWQAMVSESAEFVSLVDESVSDLLAEVEAMESLNVISSATSVMHHPPNDEDDCFSPLDGFSPTHQTKSDRTHLAVTDESFRVSPGDILYSQKHSNLNVDAEHAAKRGDAHIQLTTPSSGGATADLLWRLEPHNRDAHWATMHENINARSSGGLFHENMNSRSSGGSSHENIITHGSGGMSHRGGGLSHENIHSRGVGGLSLENINSRGGGGFSHENINSRGVGGLSHENINSRGVGGLSLENINSRGNGGLLSQVSTGMEWINTLTTPAVNPSLSMSTTTNTPYGTTEILNNQPRYGGDNRFSGQRDRDFYGRDSGFNRGSKPSRQQPVDNGGGYHRTDRQQQSNGGGYYRPQPPKSPRVCKFYESGHCKRGASCGFWHPHP
ncbi:hypothetical protein ACFE04_023300 [Oxalis oulophora]